MGVTSEAGGPQATWPVCYGLLGRIEVMAEDGPVPIPSRSQRLLLAALLLENDRPVSSDRLAQALWGDRQPLDAAGALRSHVARLRRVLGPNAGDLATVDGGYRMSVEGSRCDVARFENLVDASRQASAEEALGMLDEALALWRGPALEEFADLAFAQADAIRLEELRLNACEQRADRLLVVGRPGEAVAALRDLLVGHPSRERARELLMEALYRTGRHTDALAVYESWRRHLADERGLEPSPSLRRLEGEILRHTLAARPSQRPTAPEQGDMAGVPRPVSSFVGREREVTAVAQALEVGRLVTLTGPGGVGKTRLAIEVAWLCSGKYPDGVVFCDLAVVRRGPDVSRALAAAVRLPERGGRRLEDQLVRHFTGRAALVVLDNCEHVIDGVANLVERLTQGTRDVDVLATSRERLVADGEQVLAVPPLAVDGDDSPAVALFVQRALAAGRRAPASPSEVATVLDICRRLDGLPLAIELAAARAAALTVADLHTGLEHRFRLLKSGRRSSDRHRSLRAVVDWSYDQLDPAERRTFERLCVLNGAFDLDGARAVVGSEEVHTDDVPALVARLVERSLVTWRQEGGADRYWLLETLRAYGIERLEDRGELVAARTRHATWVLDLVERAARGLASRDEKRWADELDRHFDELRAAHAWFVGNDVDGALRLADALHPYAFWRNRSEVFRWAQVTAAAAHSSPLLPAVLASACAGAWLRGDLRAAEAALQAATAAARSVDPTIARRVVQQSAELALLKGNVADAVTMFLEASTRSLLAGDVLEAVWDRGSAALALAYGGNQREAEAQAVEAEAMAVDCGSPSALAFARFVRGELAALSASPAAEAHLRASIELATSVGNAMVAGLARVTLASVVARTHDVASALGEFASVIETWQQAGAWTSQWVTLRNLVELLVRTGAFRDAAVLYGAVVHATSGAPAFGRDETLLRDVLSRLEAVVDADELQRLISEGSRLHDDEVVAIALGAVSRGLAGATPPGVGVCSDLSVAEDLHVH